MSAARPAVRSLGHCRGPGETVPFVNRTFVWGAVIATFLSVSSVVPRRRARLTHLLRPKLREIDAVPIPPQPMTIPLRAAGGVPHVPVVFESVSTRSNQVTKHHACGEARAGPVSVSIPVTRWLSIPSDHVHPATGSARAQVQ